MKTGHSLSGIDLDFKTPEHGSNLISADQAETDKMVPRSESKSMCIRANLCPIAFDHKTCLPMKPDQLPLSACRCSCSSSASTSGSIRRTMIATPAAVG